MNELIAKLLRKNDIDPDLVIGNRTAFNIMESHVMAGFDAIEEESENALDNPDNDDDAADDE